MTAGAPAPFVQIRRPDREPRKTVALQIDGKAVNVPDGTTILAACRTIGIEIPTLCFLETLRPVNVCRVCVVEVEGSRVLVPSCSRPVEPGMVVHTGSTRVRHTRKMVLELLASSVDLSTTDGMAELLIADSGPGVSAENLERMFDRYFSHRPAGDGPSDGQVHFGIGLWVARRNVEALGGTIMAENRAPNGLLMRVKLPLAEPTRLNPPA